MKVRRNKIIILLLSLMILILLNQILLAQPPHLQFEHLSITNGLSNNTVYCILQDSRGFMWFGTQDGLNRYDGYHFTIYNNTPADSTTISHSAVLAMFENTENDLWFGTSDGATNLYNREKDQFVSYRPDFNDPNRFSSLNVRAIIQDKQQQIWVGTDAGLFRFQKNNQTFIKYPLDTRHDISVFAMLEDQKNRFWLGTNNGLYLFHREKDHFIRFWEEPTRPGYEITKSIRCLYEDQEGDLWLGTLSNGLFRLNPETGVCEPYVYDKIRKNTIGNDRIFAISGDGHENVYIGTENSGFYVLNYKTEAYNQYLLDVADEASLNNNSVYSIYPDKNGILWIGTFSGGVNYASQQTQRFRHFNAREGGLNNPYILSIAEDKQHNLWIGTDGGGLNFLNRSTDQYTYYTHDEKNPNSLSSNAVTFVYVDRKEQIWTGTYRGGLDLFNKATGKFTHFKHNPAESKTIQNNIVLTIFEDSQGNLYIGSPTGMDVFDRKMKTFSRIPYPIPRSGVLVMLEDRHHNLWIGSYAGVSFIDRKADTTITYTSQEHHQFGEIPEFVSALYEDAKGHIWIGSRDGLYLFEPAAYQFYRYSENDGLPENFVTGIVEDRAGNLWLSTTKYVVKVVDAIHWPKKLSFMNLGIYDGLKGFLQSQNGEIFFGGNHGLNIFLPEEIFQKSQIPPIVVTNFKIFNKDIGIGLADSPLKQCISETNEIALSHRQSVITFEFAALNYIYPEKNQYAYLLEGFEEQWNYVGNQRAATYTNLDPGEYVFRVKGSNNDGVWNEKGTFIQIKIIPPWWKTIWACIFYALLSGLTFYGVWRFQLNRARMKQELALEHLHAEKLEEINRMKTRFFTNVTHEFRTPLSLIIGPVKQLMESDVNGIIKKQLQTILRNSQRLYRLINQLLDLSKIEAGSMRLRTRKQDIVHLLKDLVMLFQPMAEQKQIDLRFSLENDDQNEAIEVYLDQDKLEKIISNLLSNAIKFTNEDGNVLLRVKQYKRQSFAITPENRNPVLPDAGEKDIGKTDLTTDRHDTSETKVNFTRFKNGYVEIIIEDTGIGCPDEYMDKIFDRFYQVDDSYTRKHEGTGIGLALTKELVELHHGTIHAASKYHQGTRFTIRLPLGRDHLTGTEILEDFPKEETTDALADAVYKEFPEISDIDSAEKSKAALRKKMPHILIVEDNSDLRKYLLNSLNHDCQTLEAQNGQEGLEKAIEVIPDLVVSDVMMPGMDGFELCKKLKTDQRTSHIPVILLTARATAESKIEGLETGADDYITKPFDVRELQVRIKNLIDQRRQLRMRFNRHEGLKPDEIATTSYDQKFLEKALTIIEKNLGDPDFGVAEFAKQIALSRVQLHRKIRALTGQSTSELIRVVRLNRAAQLLKKQHDTVTQIAFTVGFNSSSYFSRSFYKHFGISPSDYGGKSYRRNI